MWRERIRQIDDRIIKGSDFTWNVFNLCIMAYFANSKLAKQAFFCNFKVTILKNMCKNML